MADKSPHSFNKTHLQDPNLTPFSSSTPSKSPKSKFSFTRYFVSKSLITILVLLVFSFFPSQVPEFFNKTAIITKIWELIYLLVIGIAVSYGLFSRKMSNLHTTDEKIALKEEYLSGISHISSIFEDGFQNSYGFDEKQVFEESMGLRFLEFENGVGKSDKKKLNQYFLGESMVVINDENYVLEQLGKPKSSNRNKPLCLPIRSLGSKSLDSANVKSSSVLKDSSNGDDGVKKGKFRGLVPIKLEDKFKEIDSNSPTLLNWRSKSMRFEKREEICSVKSNETSHFRPVSIGLFDFEDQKSQSMRFSVPSQMKNSLGNEELKDEMKTQVSYKEIVKDFGKIKVEDGGLERVLGKEKKVLGSLDSSLEHESVANTTYKRGKSVRTNRRVLEAKVKVENQTDEKIEKGSRIGDKKGNGDMGNVNLDESRGENGNLSDAEPHSGEVDRKAEEFIAKFKKQIRLQRAASVKRLNLW